MECLAVCPSPYLYSACVCDLSGCARVTIGQSVGWRVETDICGDREEVINVFPC